MSDDVRAGAERLVSYLERVEAEEAARLQREQEATWAFEREIRRRVAAMDYAALADLAASLQHADSAMMRRALTTALGVEPAA